MAKTKTHTWTAAGLGNPAAPSKTVVVDRCHCGAWRNPPEFPEQEGLPGWLPQDGTAVACPVRGVSLPQKSCAGPAARS